VPLVSMIIYAPEDENNRWAIKRRGLGRRVIF
jgi:hypothetical protein